MREYLFRGKRSDGRGWVEGDFIHDRLVKTNEPVWSIWYSDSNGKPQQENVDPETVGQYTGLTDKNGVKIFEGDIVKVKILDREEYRRTVIGIGLCVETGYDSRAYGVNCDYFDELVIFPADMTDHVEVIGNIHDNQEILKEGGEE